MSGDPYWNGERRLMLRGALAKINAAKAHGTIAELNKAEGGLIAAAANAWEEMMAMLDARARAGDLEGVRRERS